MTCLKKACDRMARLHIKRHITSNRVVEHKPLPENDAFVRSTGRENLASGAELDCSNASHIASLSMQTHRHFVPAVTLEEWSSMVLSSTSALPVI